MDYLKYIAWFVPSLLGFAGNWFFKFTEDDPERVDRKRLTSPGKWALGVAIVCLMFAAYTTYMEQLSIARRAEKAKSLQTALDQANDKLDEVLGMLRKNLEFVGARSGQCSADVVRFEMKGGSVSVPISGSALVELESLTNTLPWNCGDTEKQAANVESFDVVRCERPANGPVVWFFYRKV